MPIKNWSDGDYLYGADMDFLQGSTVMRFTNAASRDATLVGDLAPTAGQVAYTSNDQSTWQYNGTAWVRMARTTTYASGFKTYRDVASYFNPSTPLTGTLRITIPNTATYPNHMIRMTIGGYQFGASTAIEAQWELKIAGYLNASQWAVSPPQAQAWVTGQPPFSNVVRLGQDASGAYILLGNTNTVWAHPAIEIEKVAVSYESTPIQGYDTGWTFSLLTSESGLTSYIIPVIRPQRVASGSMSFAFSNVQTATASVVFADEGYPAGYFDATPRVWLQVYSGAGLANGATIKAYSLTAAGFTASMTFTAPQSTTATAYWLAVREN